MKGRALKNTIKTLMASALLTFPSSLDQLEQTVGQAQAAAKPNILFIVMDDVGVDQLPLYGFGGLLPPSMPNLGLIAGKGVTFTNAWAMPECSPSRAAFFTGRYPARTGVTSAIVNNHLPQTYVSSFEATIPRVLGTAGYTSSLIGKYHLGGELDPSGGCSPSTRGWNAFRGNNSAGPPSIDKTGGGTGKNLVCGYHQGPERGACYTQSGGATRCEFIDRDDADPRTSPARTCLQRGGIFDPVRACGVEPPTQNDFERFNAYYVWPRATTTGVRPPLSTEQCETVTTNRTYMTTVQSDDGVAWWNRQSGPRMLTVSYNDMHTPYQKAPTDVEPDPGNPPSSCNQLFPPRPLLNNMLEAMDTEIGRMLADLGFGTLRADGRTLASLNLKNTVLIIVGDNGTQGGAVRVADGFDSTRAKATVYQTGVWVPLVIAGSVVNSPGREVDAMVNTTDLFHLFGEIAGINVEEIVPPSHILDSKPLMPYLAAPKANPVRKTNFTQVAAGTFTPIPRERSWPCRLNNICNDTLFATQGLCEDNGGVWYGPGGAQRATSCCSIVSDPDDIIPVAQYATRDKRYKLVELERTTCKRPLPPGAKKPFPWAEYTTKTVREFYDIKRTAENPIGIDAPDANFLKDCPQGQDPSTCLPETLRPVYAKLDAELQSVLDSAKPANFCQSRGDGNLDMRVNQLDVIGWQAFRGKGPSRYDINLDAKTNEDDLAIINANLGRDCLGLCARADLDRNGRVNNRDRNLLLKDGDQPRACDGVLCGGDLNGDGRIDNTDVTLMAKAESQCNSSEAAAVP